jgi:hypothetical protein
VPVEDVQQPGRRWLRLALLIAIAALVLLGIVVISTLGGERQSPEPASDPSASQSGTPGAALTELTPSDFDPQGDPPEENPEQLGAAVDGDLATGWRTMTYQQNLGPGGLKTGVGLMIDLGAQTAVTSAEVTFAGSTAATVYLTDQPPRTVRGLTPVASETVDGTWEVDFDAGATGRYVTVWLTSLPAGDGGFRGQVDEVVVRG